MPSAPILPGRRDTVLRPSSSSDEPLSGRDAPHDAPSSAPAEPVGSAVGRPVLSSAVGAQEMRPAVSELTLEPGDSIVLCTDGLTKHVSEERLAGVISKAENAEAGCRQLVDLALAGGGKDNVTVVVANALRG